MADPVPVTGLSAGTPAPSATDSESGNHQYVNRNYNQKSAEHSQPPMLSGDRVRGVGVTALTQCAHWHSDRDIIAIRHKCCGEYFACFGCHQALAAHDPAVWPKEERHSKAVLCGNCLRELTIAEYLSSDNVCPACRAGFNPGCSKHYDLYFQM